ncbi:subtilase-type protease inhibitor [Streptomyces monticola]|uniref:Probable subtilase-type protease inhibitor n=1 Tax=Streptomyces monticola TaxID=2666263 RepID=A0ABW2JEN3_9ACTN
MKHTLKALGTTAAVAACLLATTAGTAQAGSAPRAESPSPQTKGLYAPSDLVLSVGYGEDAATATVDRAVTLTCAPRAAGSHPAAEAACTEVRGVGGELAALVDTDPGTVCTKEWNPRVITVAGVWEGRTVSWSTTFGNPCELRAAVAGSAALAF